MANTLYGTVASFLREGIRHSRWRGGLPLIACKGFLAGRMGGVLAGESYVSSTDSMLAEQSLAKRGQGLLKR